MPDELIPEDTDAALRDAFEQLRSNYGETADETPEESTPDEGEDTEASEEGEEEESSEPTDDDDVEVNGVTIKRSELSELLRLREFLDSDSSQSLAQTAAQLEQARQRAAAPNPNLQPPTYVPPAPPEGLDLEDPVIKALWDRQVNLEANLFAQQQELLRRSAVETTDQVERSVSDWNNKYKLDDSSLKSLREEAAATNLATVYAENGKSIYEGVHAALEAAFWSNPKLRSQYLLAAEESNKKSAAAQKAKERKLSALSGRGSSTSSAKPPAEMTPDERKQAVIAELDAAINGRN